MLTTANDMTAALSGNSVPRLFPLAHYRAHVEYEVDGQPRTLDLEVSDFEQRCSAENADLVFTLWFSRQDGALVLHGELLARRSLLLARVVPLTLVHGESQELASYFHNGWQSWSGSSALELGRVEPRVKLGFLDVVMANPDLVRRPGRGEFTSSLCTAAYAKDGRGLVVGYLDTAETFGGFNMSGKSGQTASIAANIGFENAPLEAGSRHQLPRLFVLWSDDVNGALERYADRVGAEMKARVPQEAEVGWCSWYHYFTKIDEGIIRTNLAHAARSRDSLPFSLFQIDDGWQSAVGDWLLPSKTFPSGMGSMAREIESAGFKPGLWLAPFIAYPNSKIYREHRDWFVRDESGSARYAMYNNNWGLFNAARALDLTHPEVQSWLAQLFHTVAHEWGYRFIKIDFLHAAGLPGKRFDPRVSGAQALRRGLEIIRRSVGEEVHILGCGLPLGPAIGLVDSNRVGMDVAPYWTNWLSKYVGNDYDMMSAKVATRNALTRSFMHGRLWQNDPDCILLRSEQTKLSQDEIHTIVTMAAMSGGSLLISDDLALLGPAQRELAGRALQLHAKTSRMRPRALDLMESDFPTLFLSEGAGSAYLAVFNPSDTPATVRVDLQRYAPLHRYRSQLNVREYWTHDTYAVESEGIALGVIPAHSVRLLVLREAGTA